jgi:hypothetical protein
MKLEVGANHVGEYIRRYSPVVGANHAGECICGYWPIGRMTCTHPNVIPCRVLAPGAWNLRVQANIDEGIYNKRVYSCVTMWNLGLI